MELRQLKYFLAVADARSFVSAANALYLSRQAVSKAVGQLETELGVELFVRDSNGAFLTPAGLMFYDRIRSSVMELEQVRADMQRYGARYHQRIRLAFSVGTMPLYETKLQAFLQEQENVELEYRECPEEQCLKLLSEHKADLVICTGVPSDPELSVQVLLQSPMGVLLKKNEELIQLDSVEMRDLSWLPLAGIQDGGNEQFCKAHNLRMQFTGLDMYRLFRLSQMGKCAMLLPQCLVPVQMEDLCWLPVEQAESWTVRAVRLRSMENNVLYLSAVDDLLAQIFE